MNQQPRQDNKAINDYDQEKAKAAQERLRSQIEAKLAQEAEISAAMEGKKPEGGEDGKQEA